MSLILKHKTAQISYAVKVRFPLEGGAAASGREQGCGGREKLGGGAKTSGMLELTCFLNLSIKVLVTWLCKFTELYFQELYFSHWILYFNKNLGQTKKPHKVQPRHCF